MIEITKSGFIHSFLKKLEKAEKQREECAQIITQCDNETQDILHRLELEENSQYDMILMAIAIKAVRKRRRETKDENERLKLIMDWVSNNGNAIRSLKSLEKQLDAKAKVDAKRKYNSRTDIVCRVLGEQEETDT